MTEELRHGDQFPMGWSWLQVWEVRDDWVRVGPVAGTAYEMGQMPPHGWIRRSQVPIELVVRETPR